MKSDRKRLLVAAFFAFVLPLAITGSASAVRFNPDGAVQNPVTGVWELPDTGACFDGTAAIDATKTNRPDCISTANATLNAVTSKYTCTIPLQITTPAGYDLNSGMAGWNRCSNPMNNADQATCEGAGGTWSAFAKCNKYLTAADCALAGATYASSKCQTTALTAAACGAGGAISGGTAASWVGSATYNGTTTTCDLYVGDAPSCSAATGTWSLTNTDETRGNCVNNWVFMKVAGTGATATALGTGGSLTTVEARACLRCHNETYQGVGSPFAEPEKYIYASHKNASRKITPGENVAHIYRDDVTGNEAYGVFSKVKTTNGSEVTVDWSTGKIGGIDWFWFWGYHFEDVRDGSDIAADEITTTTGGGIPTRNMSSCALCHATGFSAENGLVATKEPVKTWGASIAWDGGTTYSSASGTVNLKNQYNRFNELNGGSTVPSATDCGLLGGAFDAAGACVRTDLTESACKAGGGSIPGAPVWAGGWTGAWTATGTKCTMTLAWTYNSWDEFGVLCSNCHNSVDGGHNNSATGTRKNVPRPSVAQPAYGAQVNAVCLQCHGKASSGTGVFTAAATANFAASANIGTGHPNYHGSQFMNSPHAKFAGTYAEVTDTTKYSSTFGTTYGGCEGCHNPHGSVRENLLNPALMGANKAEDGLKVACATCHATAQGPAIVVTSANINHPTGLSTPMGTVAAPTDGCVICHMPGGQHLFRIAADNVTPKADGAYADAAWILTGAASSQSRTACQQCHFAGGAAATLPFTAAQAAAAATGMHTGGSVGTGAEINARCLTCHSTVQGTKMAIVPGTNHHSGEHSGGCVACHADPHKGNPATRNGKTLVTDGNDFCLQCHGNTGSYAHHHVVPALKVAGKNCQTCHNLGGVAPASETNADCMQCHNQAWDTTAGGTVRLVNQGVDHHNGTCTTCHQEGGAYLAINAMAAPNLATTLKPAGSHNPLPYWGINTSLATACLSCHATAKTRLSDGATLAAIVPTGTGDNHHNGHSSVPGTSFGGVSEVNGSRGDNDPGMNCVGCHGKAAIVSGDNTTGYVLKITASGLSTSNVAAANGRTNTTGLCLGCHEVVQSGPTKDHHVGTCTTCHSTAGAFTGAPGAGVGTGQPSPELNTSCMMCHNTAQGTFAAIDLTTLNHLTGTGTPASFANACAKCHNAGVAPDPVTLPGVAPNITATCGQCHDAAHYVAAKAPNYTDADLALVANGIHDAAGVTYAITFSAAASQLTVNTAASVNCGGTCPDLTYQWRWYDGTFDSGASASHTYAIGGKKTIMLTVKLTSTQKTVGTYTRTITLANTIAPPVASAVCTWTANTWSMNVQDTSTVRNVATPVLQIVVDWGDGTAKTISTAGAAPSHTYTRVGTFTVTQRATDSNLQTSTTTCATQATPAYFTIGGTVKNSAGTLGLSAATVRFYRGATLVKSVVTPVGGAFSSGATLKPGNYSVTVTKTGYTFPATPVTIGASNTTLTIQALTP
jgi:hypothetical protein